MPEIPRTPSERLQISSSCGRLQIYQHRDAKDKVKDSQGDMDRTHIEPNSYLTSLFAGGQAVPHLTSQATLAKMSVTLPSVYMDDHSHSQSISTIQGDVDSSGADTF
ncbi:protein TALPID3-like [Petaurus breviceps papuanus]|uniref:protein TALPID3-like n=1 Tax=Petaurus breviceps papuanus TaxID=3040969 RepID=UPI0036DE6F9B